MIASETPSLRSWLRPERVCSELRAPDADGALAEIASLLCADQAEIRVEQLLSGLREREMLGSTGVGDGCAIPHARLPGIDRSILAVARSSRGIEFGSVDGRPVRLFFGLAAPSSPAGAHLQVLASVARWLRDPRRRESLLSAPDARAMFGLLVGA